jgi:hypothetical protein
MRDIDIRGALRLEMARRHSEEGALIVEELGLCQGAARVDVAVVNGSVHGYEIKSEYDTLARLPGQSTIYSQALEFVTIVAASAHSLKIAALIPPWWGIWIAVQDGGGIRLEEVREPQRNPGISPFAQAQLLWRQEALQALESRGLADGLKHKPRHQLWNRLASELTIEELGTLVRKCLKARNDWRVAAPQASGGG